ncbi:MAG: DsbA family protein [Eubacteriales bacterium]|nr:DsbA family protein [Eubacteriales bacterium]MDD4541772.1 DsbA family protein [Eubacteriales bacterium]
MSTLEFFYDYTCPFCMRGYHALIERLAEHPDIEVVWRPCDINPVPETNPYFNNLGIQGYFFAEEKGIDLIAYNTRVFQAANVDRIDRHNPAVYAEYLKDLLDPAELEEALRSGKYKEKQLQYNDYAYEQNGVWYIPALRMNDKKLDAAGGLGVSEKQIEEFLKKAK